MKKILFRYKYALVSLAAFVTIIILKPELRQGMILNLRGNGMGMLSVLPPVFILLGLLDVWVDRATIIKYMGDNSGLLGSLLIFVMATAAAGPLYAAFPIALMLLKKGVKLFNIFLFIGIWSTAKIPTLLFETVNLGIKYMAVRFAGNITGVIIIALLLSKTTTEEERNTLIKNADQL
jgi:uncharacterized membrane protein YraQ (UPF0718 family)